MHFSPFALGGQWGKLSDRTEFLDHGSSPEQQSDKGAHFLRGAEKCFVSPLPAHSSFSWFRFPASGVVGHRTSLVDMPGPFNCFDDVMEHFSSRVMFLRHLRAEGALPPYGLYGEMPEPDRISVSLVLAGGTRESLAAHFALLPVSPMCRLRSTGKL